MNANARPIAGGTAALPLFPAPIRTRAPRLALAIALAPLVVIIVTLVGSARVLTVAVAVAPALVAGAVTVAIARLLRPRRRSAALDDAERELERLHLAAQPQAAGVAAMATGAFRFDHGRDDVFARPAA